MKESKNHYRSGNTLQQPQKKIIVSSLKNTLNNKESNKDLIIEPGRCLRDNSILEEVLNKVTIYENSTICINDLISLECEIGSGAFGKVYEVSVKRRIFERCFPGVDVKEKAALKVVDIGEKFEKYYGKSQRNDLYEDYRDFVLKELDNIHVIQSLDKKNEFFAEHYCTGIVPYTTVHGSKYEIMVILMKLYTDDLDDYAKYLGVKTLENKIKCLDLSIKIAKALKVLHKEQIYFLDLKPKNIFVQNKEENDIYIGDFGGVVQEGSKIRFKQFTGYYASPELRKNIAIKCSPSMDVYSLGVTLLRLVIGDKSTETSVFLDSIYGYQNDNIIHDDALMIGRLIQKNVDENIDRNIIDIIIKATRYKSTDRYKNIDEVLVDLQKVRNDIMKNQKNKLAKSPNISISESSIQKKPEELAKIMNREAVEYTKLTQYLKSLDDVTNNGSFENAGWRENFFCDDNIKFKHFFGIENLYQTDLKIKTTNSSDVEDLIKNNALLQKLQNFKVLLGFGCHIMGDYNGAGCVYPYYIEKNEKYILIQRDEKFYKVGVKYEIQ